MTVGAAELASQSGPRYRALADCLERAIQETRLRPGERLPPQRDLAFDLDVTVGTVGRAYALLLKRGLVRGEIGRGTYVLDPGRARPTIPAPFAGPSLAHDLAVNRPVAVPAETHVFRLLGEIAADGAGLGSLMTYPPYAGLPAHRAALARWLASFAGPVDPGCILPSQGTQNGMAATLAAVTRPGDTILMEALSYASNHGLAGRLGLKVEPVAMDDEGALPESIDAHARQHRPAAIILSPDLQNPTLATASLARREAIVECARRHDLAIIEDAVYAPVAATGLPALRQLAPERTLLVTSISKFLAPGLRFGCVVAPAARMPQLVAAQAHFAVGVSPLIAETFARLEAAGVLAEALAQQRAALVHRRATALAALDGLKVTSRENALHVLLELPAGQEAATTVLRLAEAGIHTTPLNVFAVARTTSLAPTLRLSLGAEPDETSLASCLGRLRAILADDAAARPVI
jgi:DNA-binding transcriptional MocR family regulator